MTLLDWTDDKEEAYDRASKVPRAQRRRGFPTPECLFPQVSQSMKVQLSISSIRYDPARSSIPEYFGTRRNGRTTDLSGCSEHGLVWVSRRSRCSTE